LKDSLTYGEYKTIEGVMLSGAKGRMVGQSFDQSFDGTVIQAYQRKMIETFIQSASKDHEDVPIAVMIDGLSAVDGVQLETAVQGQYDAIKKKL
jgi:hypothetical protein